MKRIWAVSCYFNFTKSKLRLKNFKIFKRNLDKHGIKLAVVEFSPDSVFELNHNDTDLLIQLKEGDTMWQKERLLNIAVDKLPQDTDIVIVIDADVVFSDINTIGYIQKELEKKPIVQCFSLNAHINPEVVDAESVDFLSLNKDNDALFLRGKRPGCIYAYEMTGNFQFGAAGYAWAFRYEIIKSTKLFEHNIIGGGDRVSASAFIGLYNPPIIVAGINYSEYYSYFQKVKSAGINRDAVGYIDTLVYDLYHGSHEDRQYLQRHDILKNSNFDSSRDLIYSSGAPFKFSDSVNQTTKNQIIDYFYSRKEN
jgi:hypothetical protein